MMLSSNLRSVGLEIWLVDRLPIGIQLLRNQLIKLAFFKKNQTGVFKTLSSSLKSICLKIWLVNPEPIGIEFLGKQISLYGRGKDIRNQKSVELDTLLEHPWLYWVTHVTYKSSFEKNWFPGGRVKRRFRINSLWDAKFVRHRYWLLRLLKGLSHKNLSVCLSFFATDMVSIERKASKWTTFQRKKMRKRHNGERVFALTSLFVNALIKENSFAELPFAHLQPYLPYLPRARVVRVGT
jgi:hypothetical protein